MERVDDAAPASGGRQGLAGSPYAVSQVVVEVLAALAEAARDLCDGGRLARLLEDAHPQRVRERVEGALLVESGRAADGHPAIRKGLFSRGAS